MSQLKTYTVNLTTLPMVDYDTVMSADYQATIPDPNNYGSTIPNPETRTNFARRKVVELIQDRFIKLSRQSAVDTAEANAIASSKLLT